MALDLNVSPYYDDAADAIANNYNRILFKPGYAVQARELTQLQSILQDQVGKFGNHVFKNGSVVAGCEFKLDTARDFVKVLDEDASGILIQDIEDYVGAKVIGLTSSIQAEIIYVSGGSEADSPDLNTLYLRYLTGDGSTDAVHFSPGETIRVIESETGDQVTDTFVVDDTFEEGNYYYGRGSFVTLDDGIIFLDGKFLPFTKTTLELLKYNAYPYFRVGFEIVESIVTHETDPDLLDPAQGTFNYAAPGADRYVTTASLVKYALDVTPDDDFSEYITIVAGQLQNVMSEDRIYADLGRNLAKRTFDESGNYTVKAFPILIKEHLDTGTNSGLIPYNATTPAAGGDETLLAIGIEAGKAYVRGYAYETRQTEYIVVPKGNTTKVVNEVPISTAFGSYILVDNFCGNWDIAAGDTVSLRGAAANAIGTSGSPTGGATSLAGAPGSQIGTARIRHIAHETGTPGVYNTQYRMYLYDIQMTSSYNFEDVKGVYYDTTADGHANVVLVDSKAYIYEGKFNSLLFKFPARALKTTNPVSVDNSFVYSKQFDDTIDGSNTITFSVSSPESFPFTVGTLTNTEILDNILITTKAACTINSVAYEIGSVLNLQSTASVTVTNTGTQITVTFPGAISAATNIRVHCKVQVAGANKVTKELKESAVVVLDTEDSGNTTGTYNLGASDGYKLRTVKIGEFDDPAVDVQADGTDVTSLFNFDTGQRDGFYANARIVKKPGASLTLTDKKLVVTFDYFTHGGSPSTVYNFYTVDSYPVDDETTPAGKIRTEQIPIYTSTTSGVTYDLRDTLDFRPRWDDTITFTTSPASATVNPAASSSPSGPTGAAIITPFPTEQFTTDIEYYLGRKDRIVMDDEGVFSSVYGVSSLSPVEPVEPENSLSIAIVDIPPYPSLAPNVAKSVGRPDYGIKYKSIDNRRYTMRDIGQLEQRLNRLEYYTSLNLLEKSASDLSITDTNGLDRFKNGILVDAFTGHNVGNVLSNEYHIAIDPNAKEMRPFFFMENVDLQYDSANSTNITKTGDLLTLPYTEFTMMSQLQASKFRNCTGELLFTYIGEIDLDPPVDNWTDTSVLPDISANFDGNYDAWETLADAWGTQWEDWQDTGTGRVTTNTQTAAGNTAIRGDTLFQEDIAIVTTTTEQRQTRQGVQLTVTPETQTQRTGPRVTNTSIIPFMRSIIVTFKATRMKPLTRVYPFFDGATVEDHCRPLSGVVSDTTNSVQNTSLVTGVYGDPLITNASGECFGQFRIPAGTFRVGEKLFRLADDSKNRPKFVTTAASMTFSANGLSQSVQDTVISTRVANLATSNLSDSRSVSDSNTTTNRLGERAVGVVQTTVVNNTFTTINNTTNVTEVTQVTQNINNTSVTNVTNNVTEVTNVTPPTAPDPAPPVTPPAVVTPEPPVVPDPPMFEFDMSQFNWIFRLDPIAQTFMVSEVPFGCYVTSLDVYFKKKSTTNPITMQLREVVNGYPGNRVIPFGEVTLSPGQVNIDADNGATSTKFTFPSPVFLQNNTEYCFVLLPAGNDPNYEIWVSELGENQLNTTTRISEQPNVGVLFTSANNRTWTAWQAEDIKFTLQRANFAIGTTGTVALNTHDIDYAKFDSFSGSTFAPGDKIHGFSFNIINAGTGYGSALVATVAVSGTAGQFTCGASKLVVGDLVTITGTLGGTGAINSYATGTTYKVSAVTGSVGAVTGFTLTTQAGVAIATTVGTLTGLTYTVATVVARTLSGGGATTNATVAVTVTGGVVTSVAVTNPGAGYTSNPTLTMTGGSNANIGVTLNSGFAHTYDTLYNVAKIYVQSGNFTVNDRVGNGSSHALIAELEDKVLNALGANLAYMDHTPCQLIFSYSATTNTGAETVASTSYENFVPDKTTYLTIDAAIRSYSNEQNDLDGDKSFKIKLGMSSQTSTVSPAIDLRKCSMIVIANDVNNDATDEDIGIGEARSKYVSRQVVLDDGQEAEDLRVYLSQYVPNGTDVKVYGRFLHQSDPASFEDKDWIELTTTPPTVTSSSFIEYTYDIPSTELDGNGVLEYTTDGVTYTGYKTFAVKVVLLSNQTSVVPKCRELRAIALQV